MRTGNERNAEEWKVEAMEEMGRNGKEEWEGGMKRKEKWGGKEKRFGTWNGEEIGGGEMRRNGKRS